MEPTERLAAALRETLTEIVLIINETKAPTVEVRNTSRLVSTGEALPFSGLERTARPERLTGFVEQLTRRFP